MKRILAVAVGIAVGVLLAGVIAPALMLILPRQLWGPPLVWGAALVVVTAAAWAAWLLSSPGRSDPSNPRV